VNDLDPVFRRIATFNPVPQEVELPSGAMTETALLARIDELTAAMATRTSRTGSRRTNRGWVAAPAAAIAVLVLVGGVVLLFGGIRSDSPVAATVVPTAPKSTPTALPVFGGGDMRSVTVGGPGLVAVGWSRSHAPVWTSVDGMTWSRVPSDEIVFAGQVEPPAVLEVTAGGPGLVAVGAGGRGRDAAVWTSVDGITWSRVPHDEAVFDGVEMNSVTVGGPGLVAVGLVGRYGLRLMGSPGLGSLTTTPCSAIRTPNQDGGPAM